jgi:hypothetical protein
LVTACKKGMESSDTTTQIVLPFSEETLIAAPGLTNAGVDEYWARNAFAAACPADVVGVAEAAPEGLDVVVDPDAADEPLLDEPQAARVTAAAAITAAEARWPLAGVAGAWMRNMWLSFDGCWMGAAGVVCALRATPSQQVCGGDCQDERGAVKQVLDVASATEQL